MKNKILAIQIQCCIKQIIWPYQVGFMQVMHGRFNIWKSKIIIHHVKKLNKKFKDK